MKRKTQLATMRNGRIVYRLITVTCPNCGTTSNYTPAPEDVVVTCRKRGCKQLIAIGK